MAAFTPSTPLDAIQLSYFYDSVCQYFDFRIPKTKPVDFLPVFKGYLENEESRLFLTSLNDSRANMTRELQSTSSTLDLKILAVDAYYPLIFKLFNSLIQQPPVQIAHSISFEWKGFISTIDTPMIYSEVIFDLLMTLHTKSLLHYQLGKLYAREALTLTTAGQHMINAANAQDFLVNVLYPKWTTLSQKINRPAEILESTSRALMSYYRAVAQEIAVCKALMKEGGTASGVITKLIVPIVNDLRNAFDILDTADMKAKVIFDFFTHIRYHIDVMRSVLYFYMGKVSFDATNIGFSVGYYKKSKDLLKEQNSKKFDPSLPGLPKLDKNQKQVRNILQIIESHHAYVERENNFIYFQDVPKESAFPELPLGVQIMKITPFDGSQIDSHIVVFIKDAPKKGLLGSLMSAMTFSGSKSEISAIPVSNSVSDKPNESSHVDLSTEVRARTDSEIAREFQKRINTGENL